MSINEDAQEASKDSSFKILNFDVSVRAILAIMLVGTVCAMHLLKQEVKEPLYSAVLLVLGLYFGQKKAGT